MFGAYQKLYSALNSLSNISKDNDFIDNISAIDVFLSELRNVTFVIQKNYNDAKSKEVYNKLNEKYLKNDSIMKSLVDFRNETTKEHPFDLIISINCIIYTAKKIRKNVLTLNIRDKKISAKKIEDKVKKIIKSLNCVDREIYFSYNCQFLSNDKTVDIFEYARHGINKMYTFLLEFEQEICGTTTEYCDIKKKIVNKLQKAYINELTLNTNCVYQKDTDRIQVSPKARFIGVTKDSKVMNSFDKIPLDSDEYFLKGANLKERFKSFILNHIAIAQISEELMSTFIIIYNDNTYTIDTFPVFQKSELHYTIDELAKRIKTDNINAIFVVQEMIGATENLEEFSNMTHDERMVNYDKEFLAFSMISKDENIFIMFDREKISNIEYVRETLLDFKNNFINYILFPLIKEFKK